MTLFKTIAFGILLVLSHLFSFAQLPYVVHPIPPGFPTSTSLKRSNDLQVDAGNNKWLAFASFGVGTYDGANWTTYSTTNSGLPSDSAICIDFDNSGNTWIGTKEGAVYKSGSTWTVYNSVNSGLPSNVITAIFCDGATTWFGTKTGLASFDGTNWTIFNTGNSGLENDSITTMAKSGTGDLWIGTRGGLAKYNAGNWTTYNQQNSILNRFIYDLECDNFGRTWVASGILIPYTNVTGIEISFIDNSGQVKSFKEELYQYDLELAYYNISCGLAKNLNGNIYFQTSLGICEVDNNDIEIYKLPVLNMGSAAYGNLMQLDNNGTIWLVTKLPFNFYSLDISGYVYPLGDVNFRNHRFLDVNEVSAGINAGGDMHFNYSNAAYEVPKGSGKHSIFASALWIGGVDPGGQIHLAGQTYRQTGNDFWPGPIDGISVPFDSSTCIAFDRIWKMDKWKVEEFKNQFLAGNVTNGSYEVPEEIATWPAKGNGIVISQLAPFIDANGNGIYDVMNGDYPDIKGDQMLYRIFNDSLESHAETGGEKLGVEVHASAYSFYCPNIADSNQVLNWTTFYNYEIINRSAVDYDSVYMGLWTDADLGYAIDDLTGCDTLLAAGFVYNEDNLDDGTEGYGLNPPMQNIKILRGTQADPMDGLDNDLDGTIDEYGERTTMNHFQYYVNANGTPSGNPGTPLEFYNYMKSIWTNGQHVTDTLGVPTNFMFSGVPYSGSGWTQNSWGIPLDVRFLLSSGPFSLNAGDTATLDFAYVFTWDSLSPNGLTSSIARNQADLQRVQSWFDNNSFPSCQTYSVGVDESENHLSSHSVYPNPASEKLFISVENGSLYGRAYSISNLLGEEISGGRLYTNSINISKLPPQIYLLKIDFDNGTEYAKFVKW